MMMALTTHILWLCYYDASKSFLLTLSTLSLALSMTEPSCAGLSFTADWSRDSKVYMALSISYREN